MSKKKLEQIDRALIELLSQRITVLAQPEANLAAPSLDEQLVNVMPILTQTGVPEFLWQSLVNGCTAALAKPSLPLADSKSRRVTIIGGRGLMGSFFTQWLSASGHEVNILEHNDWNRADKLLGGVDMVLVCVPLNKMPEVIRKAAKYLDETTALADVASIKSSVVQTMLEHHSGPVIGLHPMFGGGIKSFLSQNVAVCPGRECEAFQWLLELIEQDGGKIVICTAEEHDRMMTTIQAIRHFVTFSLGVFLAAEDVDLGRSLEIASPAYRMEIGMLSRLFSNSTPLYIDIMLATQERREAIERLANTYSQLAQLIVQKDRDFLLQKFEAVRSDLEQQMTCTLEESTHSINSLSTLLTAQRMSKKNQEGRFVANGQKLTLRV